MSGGECALPFTNPILESLLAAATGAGYYVPHYLLKLFLNYLEGDSDRSDPAWGWLLAFGLFVSNAIIYVASGVLWSLSTTVLQAGIKLQLNTLLFGKTLVKKDIAATGDKLGTSEKPGEKEEEKEGEDEEVNSKTQIMVRDSDEMGLRLTCVDALHGRCGPSDRFCLPR